MDVQRSIVKVNGKWKLVEIITVSSPRSREFDYLKETLSHTSVVGLDAEWKPQGDPKPKLTPATGVGQNPVVPAQPAGFNGGTEVGSLDAEGNPPESSQTHSNGGTTGAVNAKKKGPKTLPFVCVLQIACQSNTPDQDPDAKSVVFLVDLVEIRRKIEDKERKEKKEKKEKQKEINPLIEEIYDLLKDMFEAPNILKLGHGLETDMTNLSSSFQKELKARAFNKVLPVVEIKKIYKKILTIRQEPSQTPGSAPKKEKEKGQTPGLNNMSQDILKLRLDKVGNQKSNWETRPLNRKQKKYAALDVFCLIEILNVFRKEVPAQGVLSNDDVAAHMLSVSGSPMHTTPLDSDLLSIVKEYHNELGVPKKKSQQPSGETKPRVAEGPKPWKSPGDDGRPMILCVEEAVELVARLRALGIDTKIADSHKQDGSSCIVEWIEKAEKEKGVVLRLESPPEGKPQKGKELLLKRIHYKNYFELKCGCENDQPTTEVMEDSGEDRILECSRCTKVINYAQVALIDGERNHYCGNCKDYFDKYDEDLSKELWKLDRIVINSAEIRKQYGKSNIEYVIEEARKEKRRVERKQLEPQKDDCPKHKQLKKFCIDHWLTKVIKALDLEKYKYLTLRCTRCNKDIIDPEEASRYRMLVYCTTCKHAFLKYYNNCVRYEMGWGPDEPDDELDFAEFEYVI